MTGTRRYIEARRTQKVLTRCCVERCDNEPEPGAKMCAAHHAQAMEAVSPSGFIRPLSKAELMRGKAR